MAKVGRLVKSYHVTTTRGYGQQFFNDLLTGLKVKNGSPKRFSLWVAPGQVLGGSPPNFFVGRAWTKEDIMIFGE